MNKKTTYRLIIGTALLLFTQLVIPNLHHHSDRHYAHGISIVSDDECVICALDIVPADFISPVLFAFSTVLLLHISAAQIWSAETLIFSIYRQGRAPPAVLA